jgi:holin-like protein
MVRAGSNRVAYVAAVGAGGPFARQAVDRPAIPKFVTKFSVVVLQILGLWGLNFAGVWAVDATALPVPSNLLGMVALYVLLALGVVKVSWFDTSGSFLIKHLAFFFIPITVGLLESGRLLAQHGIAIVVTLIASAAVGIVLSGLVSQFLLDKPWRQGGRS